MDESSSSTSTSNIITMPFNSNNGASITKTLSSSSSSSSSKRLLFDRRYGWVYDEWKDPSEEALAGGRGMFCILPLANALAKVAFQSINQASKTVVKVLEKPDEFSPQALQASFSDHFQKFMSSLQLEKFNLFNTTNQSYPIISSSCSELTHQENNDLHNN